MKNIIYKPSRIVILFFSILTVGLGIVFIIAFYKSNYSSMITLSAAIFCVFSFLFFIRFRIQITNNEIIQFGFRKKVIFFSDIISIQFIEKKLIVSSIDASINVTTELEKHEEAIGIIADRVKDNPIIKVYGDTDTLEAYGLKVQNEV